MNILNASDQAFLQNNPEMAKFFLSKENVVATKLVAERLKVSKSIEEVATELNIAAETIIQIENGNFNDRNAFKKLVDFYQVTSDEIDFFLEKELHAV
ncbi:helix-turn-helix transcriptional regulator [Lysinibacillus sp. FSL K6-0232]|uniref:helix-turn-helix domain-containing protein n=1 Tax=Lysinibacillus sp. FSL K6-0232 TaxID=2921425 RepID=UPI0030FA0445